MENINNEIWRPIEGYEGLYEVSNLGRVKSLIKNKILKTHFKTSVRDSVRLGRCCIITLQKLVAKAFPEICGEWFEGCDVHHKDFDKFNNCANNLQILTKEEHKKIHSESELTSQRRSDSQNKRFNNMQTAKKTVIKKSNHRKSSPSKKIIIMLNSYGDIMNMFQSAYEAAEQTGWSRDNICRCCLGQRKTCGGFYWEYLFG